MEENKVRYSDEELEEFRQLINEKLAVAKADYEILMEKINGGQPATYNAAYNLAGQRVGEHYKGIVIKNGKKMIYN